MEKNVQSDKRFFGGDFGIRNEKLDIEKGM